MRLRGIAFSAATAVGAVLSFGCPASANVVGVDTISALSPNDTIGWGQLGAPYTVLSGPQTVTSAGGLSATVSSAGGTLERLDQNNSCCLDFPAGQHLLWDTTAGSDITLNFAAPVRGVGFEVQSSAIGPFSAQLIGSNGGVLGSFTATRTDYFGDAFVGLLSTSADISQVRVDLPSPASDFQIGTVYLNTTPSGGLPANLVHNPAFNLSYQGAYVVDAGGTLNTAPDNWTLTPAASNAYFYAANGEAVFGAYGSGDDELSQVLNTTPGRAYRLRFNLAHDPTYDGSPDNQNDFSVQFGGSTLFSLVNAAAFGWTQETFMVKAASAQSALAFFGQDVPSQWELTDVSVTAVPEPATWAMLLVGLGGLGAALRQRRRERTALAA